MNYPLCLDDSFRNFARILSVFNEEEVQKEIGGHVVTKCKEDKIGGISVTNFRFMEEILDVSCPLIYWKKGKAIKGLSVRIMEL